MIHDLRPLDREQSLEKHSEMRKRRSLLVLLLVPVLRALLVLTYDKEPLAVDVWQLVGKVLLVLFVRRASFFSLKWLMSCPGATPRTKSSSMGKHSSGDLSTETFVN